MPTPTLVRTLEHALAEIPVLDIHTHLVGGKLGARGLHDVLLFHMVVSDLYAAGCPSGARLTQFPDWPTVKEAHGRIEETIRYLPLIRNTSSFWGVRLIQAGTFVLKGTGKITSSYGGYDVYVNYLGTLKFDYADNVTVADLLDNGNDDAGYIVTTYDTNTGAGGIITTTANLFDVTNNMPVRNNGFVTVDKGKLTFNNSVDGVSFTRGESYYHLRQTSRLPQPSSTAAGSRPWMASDRMGANSPLARAGRLSMRVPGLLSTSRAV